MTDNISSRERALPLRFSRLAMRARPSGIRAAQTARADMIAFSKGHPDQSRFPTGQLREMFGYLLSDRDRAEASLQYSAGAGTDELRGEIGKLMQTRGVDCGAENVLITNGSQQGLFLAALAFADADAAVVARQPAYTGALQVFETLGLALFEPEAAPGDPALIYEIPNFHNPTGICLDLPARKELVDRARRGGAILIEDDPYGMLRYDGEDLPGLLAIDAGQDTIETARTLHLGSLSKTIAPGLRIGWVAGPSDIIARLAILKYIQDIQSGTLVQQGAAAMLRADFAGELDRARATYRMRRDALAGALETHFGQRGSWIRPEGGFYIWVRLSGGLDAAALLQRAIPRGVNFVPGSAFGPAERYGDCLRLSFSHVPINDFDRGVRLLAEAYDELASV